MCYFIKRTQKYTKLFFYHYLRSEKAKLNLLDNDYCALYDGNEQLDFAA